MIIQNVLGETLTIIIGTRVELSPACDAWMRGAKHGEVRRIDGERIYIKSDNPRIRRLLCCTPDLIQRVIR